MDWKPNRDFIRSNPTYDVEKDAPPWAYPTPPETRWSRKEVDKTQEVSYDAYPERALGEPIAQPDPKPIREAPQPTLQLKLIVQGPTVSREVPLEKGFLEMFRNSNRLQQGYLSNLIAVTVRDVKDEEGQGLAEYALIIALVAIVVIVAALFLGTQISSILNNIGSSV